MPPETRELKKHATAHLGRHDGVDHLLLELLLHSQLPLHQQRLAHLHEGVPHPNLPE